MGTTIPSHTPGCHILLLIQRLPRDCTFGATGEWIIRLR